MKTGLHSRAVLTALSLALLLPARAAEAPAGLVDLGPLSPPAGGGQFVEVHLRGNLLAMAARLVAREEPELAEMLRGIQAVRVHVVGLDDSNRTEVQSRIARFRQDLADRGWERIVTAQTPGEDVAIFLKTRGDEAIEGVAVTVLEGDREAVCVNVAGDLRPDKLAELGEKLGIQPLHDAGLKLRKKPDAH
jgi:hypothetical protein